MKRISILMLAVLCSVFVSCQSNTLPDTKPVESNSTTETIENSTVSEMPHENLENSLMEDNTVTETTGNIKFTYNDNVEKKSIDGENYYYYTDNSFFFVNSGELEEGVESVDQNYADVFFDGVLQTYQTGDWSNGTMVVPPTKTTQNGVDIWLTEIHTVHSSGENVINSTALMSQDGIVTAFWLITPEYEYVQPMTDFANMMKTIEPA